MFDFSQMKSVWELGETWGEGRSDEASLGDNMAENECDMWWEREAF